MSLEAEGKNDKITNEIMLICFYCEKAAVGQLFCIKIFSARAASASLDTHVVPKIVRSLVMKAYIWSKIITILCTMHKVIVMN